MGECTTALQANLAINSRIVAMFATLGFFTTCIAFSFEYGNSFNPHPACKGLNGTAKDKCVPGWYKANKTNMILYIVESFVTCYLALTKTISLPSWEARQWVIGLYNGLIIGLGLTAVINGLLGAIRHTQNVATTGMGITIAACGIAATGMAILYTLIDICIRYRYREKVQALATSCLEKEKDCEKSADNP